jgi:LysM repeat protein
MADGNWQAVAPGWSIREVHKGRQKKMPITSVGTGHSATNAASFYTVRRGDTLDRIARRNDTTVDALLAENQHIRNPNRIYPGMRIVLPGRVASVAVPDTATTNPGNAANDNGAGNVDSFSSGPSNRTYTVRPGDTLSAIANRHGVSVFSLMTANGDIRNPNRISVGDELDIPAGNAASSAGAATGASRATSSRNAPFGHYPPFSAAARALFRSAARSAGLPESWGDANGLHQILNKESKGKVGIPNYTYGRRRNNPARWGEIHNELKRGRIGARSSATGLGQLLLANVDRYYPSGRRGIGDPHEEAVGMLRYIADRYGTPARAWRLYGTRHEGY